jgi:hypothetical protein
MDPERRSALVQSKLDAIARRHLGLEHSTPTSFPGGAARHDGDRGAVLVEDEPARSLGKAMAWARQHDVGDLHLIVEADAGLLARRAGQFTDPPTVWWLHGTDLHAVEPEPFVAPPPADAAPELVALLDRAGLDVVREHGRVAGELRGLEVARIKGDVLEVGVGEADRELTAMLHGDLAPADALDRVVAIVADQRRPGGPPHPLHQLVPERWLRWTLRHEPARIGLARLDPAPSPAPRKGLRERDVACATSDGVVVVCSVGVDLDLVPAAADARLALDPLAALVLVVPERDDHPVTRSLAERLTRPATIETISGDWRS